MAIVKQSRYAFAETVARLVASLGAAGNTIFATIDQTAAAEKAGLMLRPTTLIVFGNPKGGTPLMEAFPLAALDLPLKLLVWQDGDVVIVAYDPVSDSASRRGINGKDVLIATLDANLHALTDSIV